MCMHVRARQDMRQHTLVASRDLCITHLQPHFFTRHPQFFNHLQPYKPGVLVTSPVAGNDHRVRNIAHAESLNIPYTPSYTLHPIPVSNTGNPVTLQVDTKPTLAHVSVFMTVRYVPLPEVLPMVSPDCKQRHRSLFWTHIWML